MSAMQPIKIYGSSGPNPPKIALLCEGLNIPYEAIHMPFPDLKKPEYLKINPNGRMPAIQDPNTGITLWESGAIIEYLIEKYDKEQKMSFAPGSDESYLAKQWLFYQVSGQGPYFGQAMWFTIYHPEQVESAKTRYYNEIKRVTSVLEEHLKKQPKGADGPWLVGGKYSYADMAFLPWQQMIGLLKPHVDLSEFTEVAGWVGRISQQKGVADVMKIASSETK